MFCHLHVRSGFTFLFGTFTPERLVERVKVLGMGVVALTDRGGLYGAVKFTRLSERARIKPILGIEAQLSDGSILVLLARTEEGYRNLCRLITLSRLRHEGMFPLEEILERSRGLICLTGGREGRLWRLVQAGREQEALDLLRRLKEAFGEDLYVEVQNHGLEGDGDIVRCLLALSKKAGLKAVGTNAVTFLEREDWRVHRVLVGIQRAVHHRKVSPVPSAEFYLKSEEEMRRVLPQEVLKATQEIVEKVEFELRLFKVHPPRVFDRDTERLTELCMRQLGRRYRPVKVEALRRLWRELELITSRGFSSYFVVVHEIVSWARERGIRSSVRGSAVSSLVSHLLFGGPDPLEHGLLFERFLNEGRFDPPDIDVDFDSERREEVIRYALRRFEGQAALVSTVPTFRARSAVREVACALGRGLEELPRLTECLPYYLRPSDIPRALKELPELKESPLRSERELLELAGRLDGLPRQLSQHLGGVIVSEKLLDMVPLELSPRGYPLSQYDRDDVEMLGLPKFDLLGLRMHTAISNTLSYIRQRGIELDLDRVPLDDPATYRFLRSTETVGVFQVESPGQRQLLGRLQPDRFSDVIAEISLFRPGPMQAEMITPFIRRKHGKEPITYLHPKLKPILEETYGVLIYQEQVLRVVAELTGSGLDWADAFRRSMTHDRSPEEMEKLKGEFISRCLAQGHSPELAEEAWRQVSAFAAYGFCKAHAAAFAYITYQSAYLKAHFPLEFYLGLLNAGQVGTYPHRVILNEARRRFPVYPPHVNFSRFEYTREGNGIRVGFCAVRGMGPRTAERIVGEREAGEPFRSVEEFQDRVRPNRRIFEVLWAIGALEGLEGYGREAA